ncbi:uncharacterized protein GLRG_06923 [Colletotrichum graminicola M1.001]|uniref:Uncharacterized protein n=1 Tax=Colletotrichum graminicola (strain M1.001 / M2 / FGSC 10212) TaxID=645133 RepID=E3QL96_COLGM|nr:uncharacterized protein GLRG_06923 [Colletotrichum graminicola M1.001]EFQ31634.1 hypothetical protein GLRG_06923 [Colletotrichum graminicola M1.001]
MVMGLLPLPALSYPARQCRFSSFILLTLTIRTTPPAATSSPTPAAAAFAWVGTLDDTEPFPFFDKLDSDQGLGGTRFYDEPNDHWCLLAQITEVERLLRVRLSAVDREGRPFVIAFYPAEKKAGDIDVKRLRVGHTIAILYANQHFFLDGTDGVRVEDLSKCRVFPVDLDSLFRIHADYHPAFKALLTLPGLRGTDRLEFPL